MGLWGKITICVLFLLAAGGCSSWVPQALRFESKTFTVANKAPVFRQFRAIDESLERSPGMHAGQSVRNGQETQFSANQYSAMAAPSAVGGVQPINTVVMCDGKEVTRNTSGAGPLAQLVYGGENGEWDVKEPYRFSIRDRFRLSVRGYEEFSGELTIEQDGTVMLPNTEIFLEVAGLTKEGLEAKIKEAIRPFLRTEPHVTVLIRLGQGGFYYIFGDVNNQGRFPIGIFPMRLSEAVFRANSRPLSMFEDASGVDRLQMELEASPREGFSIGKYADLRNVSVITPHRSRPTRRIHNVRDAIYAGVTGNDPVVHPGQIIFVPSTVDKRIMDIAERIVAPIHVVGGATRDLEDWRNYYTGKEVDSDSSVSIRRR